MIVYRIPVGLFFPAPVAQGRQASPAHGLLPGAKGGGEHHQQRLHLGRTFLVVLIIFVVTTAVAYGDRNAFGQRGGVRVVATDAGLPGAVPAVSWSWLSRCRPGAEAGRRRGRGGRRGGNAGPGRGDHSAVCL